LSSNWSRNESNPQILQIFGEPEAEEHSPSFNVHDQRTPERCDEPVVHQLSLAFFAIRKEIEAGLVKEKAILQALKNLDACVPELGGSSPPSAETDFSETPPRLFLSSGIESLLSDSRESAYADAQD
jgi:hypothetical protein